MKRLHHSIVSICLLVAYVASYAYFYAGKVPAANLAYFAYLHGGVETDRAEYFLYYLYYPIYKVHRSVGGYRHNFDRPVIVYPKDFKG